MDDKTQDNVVVIDAEEVIEESVEPTEASVDAVPENVNVLLSLEEMIKTSIATVSNLRSEIKKHQEMFNDSFLNNPTYIENDKKVKEANKVKSTTRQEIIKQPAVAQLSGKIKDMRTDMKEKQNSLSDYLLEYQRLTGATQIEDNDGNVLDISNSAKLIKRSDPRKDK